MLPVSSLFPVSEVVAAELLASTAECFSSLLLVEVSALF
jgi:hypothetical protein